ncbi:MAG: hypothetical protein ACN6PP_00615 [Delftia tsuruhatensis]
MTNQGIDFTSPTWRAIERHANAQIDTLRKKNDSPNMDALRTTELRGRIAAWKELLALAPSAQAQPADAGSESY